jgi:eukaryotic-like serine/threonine-protein kinase
VAFHPRENAEPLAGYLLCHRIGIGGYGEVWKVSAPGGLTKAIKFVHGQLGDDRGDRELKALGRIKEVRHPFLLSLERFDVVDGQLFIVSELADRSMMDRFRECRDAGAPGIPRAELLGYLADAADALDYMSDKHALQHLDIKPENLLLVGGRVKVADFGLVKDLRDKHCTTIGGVTPVYATPEAFDGKASRQSDQYSLAIVYQEMLTGVLPFPGATTAQLAAQHLHSPPLLSALPVSDRPVIARALSKQPEARFATCREMVDRLLRLEHAGAPTAGVSSSADADRNRVAAREDESPDDRLESAGEARQATVVLRSTPSGASIDETSRDRHRARPQSPDLPRPAASLPLEPLEANGASGPRPTLFLGIGGAAAEVLRGLRQRLTRRFGEREELPAIRFLLFDTDPVTLRSAEQGGEAALAADETLYLPLRKPADYRNASDKLLSWLSRRWLYNIPRSLRTDGLRPLGRLAYVDHAAKIARRLHQSLADMTLPEAIERTSRTIGAPARDVAPRVFIISSICGGTGGGMLLDMAYTVRRTLGDMGLPADGVSGVMLHVTFQKSQANDLRKANAYAVLTELNHFMEGGGAFRSGPTEILPAGELSEPPFSDAYLVELGQEMDDAAFQAAAERVAHYLYLDAATACGAALDRCRLLSRQRAEVENQPPRLRSFGLATVACEKFALVTAEADAFCRRLVERWHGDSLPDLRPEKPTFGLDELTRRLAAVADKALGCAADVYFRNLVAQCSSRSAGGDGPRSEALRRVNAVLGVAGPAEPSQSAATSRVEEEVREGARSLATATATGITQSISSLLDTPKARLPAATLAVNMFQEHLRDLRQAAEQGFAQYQTLATEIAATLQRGEAGHAGHRWLGIFGGPASDSEPRLLEYCHARLQTIIHRHLVVAIQSVASGLASFLEQLVRLRPRLEELSRRFAVTSVEGLDRPSAGPSSTAAPGGLPRLREQEPLVEFEQAFQREVIDRQGGLLALAAGDDEVWASLATELRDRARRLVFDALDDIDAAKSLLERHPNPAMLAQSLREAAGQASLAVRCGEARTRLLAVVPRGRNGERLATVIRDAMPDVALTLFDADSDLVLCREGEDVSLLRAATALIDDRPDFAAAARRVHTRTDVSWMPLAVGGE